MSTITSAEHLHPFVVASIKVQGVDDKGRALCGCDVLVADGRGYLCDYHDGFQDGIDILTERQPMTLEQTTEALFIYDKINPDREFTVKVGEEEVSIYGDYYSTVTFTNCKTQEVESYGIDTRPMLETILTPLEVLKEAHKKRLLNAKIRQEMQAIKDIYGPDETMETK